MLVYQNQGVNKERIRRGTLLIMGMFALALALRLPGLFSPDKTLFDEGLFTTFAIRYAARDAYFDVHPQLGTMLFALAAGNYPRPTEPIHKIGSSFETFPFARARLLSAVLGSMLVALVTAIALLVWQNNIYAYLAGFLVAIDNSLILYSRLILPDTILLFFGFAGILLFLLAEHFNSKLLYILAGVCIGSAISVKWNGLGFIAPGALFLLLRRAYKKIALMVVSAFVVYAAAFVIFFWRFDGAPVDSWYFEMLKQEYHYPDRGIASSLLFLGRHTKVLFDAHHAVPSHSSNSAPWLWPFGHKPISFFNGGRIFILVPNYLAWWFLIAVIPFIGFIAVRDFMRKRIFETHAFFFVGYAALYAPLYFVGRGLFLYHYLPPVIFGYLLVPLFLEKLSRVLLPDIAPKKITFVFIAFMLSGALAASPYTYGLVYF